MKELKKIKKAKLLTKMEQKIIKGGDGPIECVGARKWCPPGYKCGLDNLCWPL